MLFRSGPTGFTLARYSISRGVALSGKVRIAIPLPAAVPLERPHLFLGEHRVVDYAAPQAFFRQGDLLVAEVPVAKFDPAQPSAIAAPRR